MAKETKIKKIGPKDPRRFTNESNERLHDRSYKKINPKNADVSKPIDKEELRIPKSKSATPSIDEKKETKKDRKDMRIENIIRRESGASGIDLENLQKAPLGEESKKRIEQGISKGVSKEIAEEYAGLTDTYTPPPMEDTPVLDKADLKDSVKRQRKARWGDALTAFGTGLQGGILPQSAMRSRQIEAERQQQFKDFKDITERNKKTQTVWEDKYRDDLLNWLDNKIKDTTLTASEKAKYKQAADELKARKKQFKKELGYKEDVLAEKVATRKSRESGKYFDKTGRTSSTAKDKYPHSDKYFKLAGSSPAVLNEFAKMSGYKTDKEGNVDLDSRQEERLASTLLSRMYEVDEDGNLTDKIKPGMENYIEDLSNKIEQTNTLQSEIDELEDQRLQAKSGQSRRKQRAIDEEYDKLIAEKKKELIQSQNNTNNLLSGEASTEDDPIKRFTK